MAEQIKEPTSEEFEKMLDEVARQFDANLKFFYYPPFTVAANQEKVDKIFKDMLKVRYKYEKSARSRVMPTEKIFNSVYVDNKKMFDGASVWMERSDGDWRRAAQIYAKEPGHKMGDLMQPRYVSSGWVP